MNILKVFIYWWLLISKINIAPIIFPCQFLLKTVLVAKDLIILKGHKGLRVCFTFSYWKISLSGLRGQSQWSSGQLIGFKIAIDILTREAGGCRHCKGKTDHFLRDVQCSLRPTLPARHQ